VTRRPGGLTVLRSGSWISTNADVRVSVGAGGSLPMKVAAIVVRAEDSQSERCPPLADRNGGRHPILT